MELDALINNICDDVYDFHIEEENELNSHHYCVMSIDIGIIHLAISVSTLDEDYNLLEIIWIDLIDITTFNCSKNECELYHTKTFTDQLNHVFKENIKFFNYADFILIERQPPMGLVAIEQLIFSKYREKAILVSPNSMHAFFGIGKYDYDQRKIFTEKIAKERIMDQRLLEQLTYYDRVHDIGDSIAQMLYWIYIKKQQLLKKREMDRLKIMKMKYKGSTLSVDDFFSDHQFITPK